MAGSNESQSCRLPSREWLLLLSLSLSLLLLSLSLLLPSRLEDSFLCVHFLDRDPPTDLLFHHHHHHVVAAAVAAAVAVAVAADPLD